MLLFVTGGTGFLGVNLVRLLTSQGHRLRVLARPRSPRIGLVSDLIDFRHGDVTDRASLAEAMDDCEEVYHLAGWVHVTPWGRRDAWRINVEGTRNVCEAALAAGVRRLVYTSSIAAIGCAAGGSPADETTPWTLGRLRIPYYDSKREAERVVQSCVERGLDAVIVNPTYVIGPWDVKPTAGRMILQVATGRQRVYPVRGGVNFVDVRQAARGHVAAMAHGRIGERYILGGENLTYRAFFERVAAMAGVPAPGWGVGYATLALPSALGSLAGRVFPHTFEDCNLSVLRSGFIEHYVTQAKAERELGVAACPIEGAIRDALAWFVEHGYLPAAG
ncbi:MAG: NAD-dependent epimerase/dehydratase family protein [Phycisphaerales bacterium]|nr:MAG: NAD-dependent epimerase/dehydratase family protein [Phycisphaerales bacterium]